MLNWATVADAASGRWYEVLTTLGVDGELLRPRHGPCPGCGGKDRFRFVDQGRGEWYCSGAGESTGGDGFNLLGHVHGWGKVEQLHEVARALGLKDRELTPEERRSYAQQRELAELERKARADGEYLLRVLERVTARYRVRYSKPAGVIPLPPDDVLKRARAQWGQAQPLEQGSRDHPYLERKQVGAYGLRVHKNGMLLVPVRQVGGRMIGLQFLPADEAGRKTFIKGMAPMAGAVHIIGEVHPEGWLCVAEGYATGATIHECELPALGGPLPVAIGWSTACLEATGRALLARWPRLKLIWLADWDDDKPNNPGVVAASWAAEVCGGLVLPAPGRSGHKLDWNDAAVRHGAEFLRAGWEDAWALAVAAAQERARNDRAILRRLLNG